MTYVVAFKSANNVFMCADMAITRSGENLEQSAREQSVFGEKIVSSKDTVIHDSLPKIIQVSDQLLLGFAGDVSIANAIIEDLKLRVEFTDISSDDELAELLRMSILNCLWGDSANENQIILATIIDSKPIIAAYNRDGKATVDLIEDIVQIGSLTRDTFYTSAAHYICSIFGQATMPTHRILPCVTSFFQSFGVHAPILQDYGVGGAITGASLSSSGVSWQDNIVYVLYDDLESPKLINVININGSIFSRDAIGNYGFFINTHNPPAFANNNLPVDDIKSLINTDAYKYISFINKKSRNIILLEREPLAKNSMYSNLAIENETTVSISIGPKLYAMMVRPQEKEGPTANFQFIVDKEEGTLIEPHPVINGKIYY